MAILEQLKASESGSDAFNFFTIDLEDWFHANYQGAPVRRNRSTVEADTHVLLDLLEQHDAKATFFCLGQVAQAHRPLIKAIHAQKHEIASHGFDHLLAYSQTPNEFKEDVYRCKAFLEDLIGTPVIGYRAPSWSIVTSTLWALEVLEELGFAYDSSIFPTKTPLYGISHAPRFPYVPRIAGRTLKLIEFPPATYRILGINIGIAGGFYLRILPLALQIAWAHSLNRQGHRLMCYVHPREINPAQPRLELSPRDTFVHYYGIGTCADKIGALLRSFRFVTLKAAVKDYPGADLQSFDLSPCDGGKR